MFGTVFPALPIDIERLKSFANVPERWRNDHLSGGTTIQDYLILTQDEFRFALAPTLAVLKHQPTGGGFMRTAPFARQPIHVDYPLIGRSTARSAALNIVLSRKRGYSNFYFVDEDGVIVEEYDSDYLTLYRVDRPHYADNTRSDEPRIVFSMSYYRPYEELVGDLLL